MNSSAPISRNLILFMLVLPVAALVGYQLATPDSTFSWFIIAIVSLIIASPIILRWHHPLLIISWNIGLSVFLMPGQPEIWMLLALASLGISFLDWLLTKRESFVHVPAVTWSLLALAMVTFLTARVTGGIRMRSLGGDTYGGKRYILILLAIAGFFALAFQRIPPHRARFCAGLFFLSGLTPLVSNLAYLGGPSFYFLFWIFPASYAIDQAVADWTVGGSMGRLSGFNFAGMAAVAFLLQRYGIRRLVQLNKPWRWLSFIGIMVFTLLGGFRSSVVIFGLLMASLFILERLYKTRLMIGAVVTTAIGMVFLVSFVDRLPLTIQRSLSILPINVSPIARTSAENTTEWRVMVWRFLLPEVPKHLIVPKGFGLDPTEMYLLAEGTRRGVYNADIEMVVASGSYHSGPLTLVLGLGIWGVIAFGIFAAASLKVLYKHYRNSLPELATLNTFLFAYFVSRLIYFLFVYGHFAEDLFIFTGIIGLSLSVNGGLRKKAPVHGEQPQTAVEPHAPGLLPQPGS